MSPYNVHCIKLINPMTLCLMIELVSESEDLVFFAAEKYNCSMI